VAAPSRKCREATFEGADGVVSRGTPPPFAEKRANGTPPNLGGEWRRYAAVLIAGILICSCSSKKKEAEEEGEHVVTVDVAPVLSSPISLKVTADALLYPLQQAAIVPKIAAPVRKFYVERGATVRAGKLLAELENRDLAGAVAENQATLEQAEANYQSIS